MADRDLRVPDFIRLYEAHGCSVKVTRKQFVKLTRRLADGTVLFWAQHAHKGLKDVFNRRVVRRSRVELQFHEVPDDEFYAPLD
jgi:hypothetical protein